MTELEKINKRINELNEVVNQAYWNFTRQARAKPPYLAVPEAYIERSFLEKMRSEIIKKENP